MITPLFICGSPSSGKSNIMMHFDMSSDFVGIPGWHDMIGNYLLYYDRNQFTFDHVAKYTNARYAVAYSIMYILDSKRYGFGFLECMSLYGKRLIAIPPDIEAGNLKFEFDYYEFRKKCILNIYNMADDDLLSIYDAIYRAFSQYLPYSFLREPKYGMSMLSNDFYRFPLFDRSYKNYKMIYLIRDMNKGYLRALQIWAKESNTTFIEELRKNETNGVFLRTLKAEMLACRYAQNFPEKVRVIEFEKMVFETETTLKSICAWLGVKFSQDMLTQTFMGQKVPNTAIGHIVDDDFPLSLSEEEIALYEKVFFAQKERAAKDIENCMS